MANLYVTGSTIRLSVAFTNLLGVLTNPTTTTLIAEDPTGAQTTYSTPTNDSTGNFHQDITATVVGVWKYRWTGTGAVVAAAEGSFTLAPSAL